MNNWQKMWEDFTEVAFRPPKSADEVRRNWLKSMSKEELWLWHDEVVKELKSR